jgi:hypothetical protein
MSLELLLSRLQKVKRSGPDSYMACCPAHDDKTPSLAIKDTGEGKILINCLASCATEDVLGALGMDWEDVMPPKLATPSKPQAQKVYPSDALRAMQSEARVVMMAAFDMAKGKQLNDEDVARLKLAMQRINTAMELANVN